MSGGPKAAKAEAPAAEAVEVTQKPKSALKATYGIPSEQSSLDLNDIPAFASEPGPGHYYGPGSQNYSALGPQQIAKCATAPEINFPRTGWEEWTKVQISKGHSNSPAYLGKVSTGHHYTIPSGLNKKTTKIGTSLRPELSSTLGVDPHGSPGPTYNLRDTPGQALGEGGAVGSGSFEPRPGKGRMNKGLTLARRFERSRGGSLGPGAYTRKDVAVDGNTGRSIGVGRNAWEKVITPGWEVEGRCRTSQGPGPPLWTDIKTEGSRSHSIGRAERFPRSRTNESPGPGAYNREERAVGRPGRQHLSDTRTPKQTSFGTQPKKPRFRNLLAQQCTNAAWGYF